MTAPPKVAASRTATKAAPRTARTTGRTGAVRTPVPPRKPALWWVAPTPRRAPRTPFVLLIIGVLGCGLVALLLLNTATASGSFRERSLQDKNSDLTLRQQALQREVSALEAPGALAKAAAALGMVPGPDPAFLVLGQDGSAKVVGDPEASASVPPPPPPTTVASPTPTPSPSQHPKSRQSQHPRSSSSAHPSRSAHPTGTSHSAAPPRPTGTPTAASTPSQHRSVPGGHR